MMAHKRSTCYPKKVLEKIGKDFEGHLELTKQHIELYKEHFTVQGTDVPPLYDVPDSFPLEDVEQCLRSQSSDMQERKRIKKTVGDFVEKVKHESVHHQEWFDRCKTDFDSTQEFSKETDTVKQSCKTLLDCEQKRSNRSPQGFDLLS